MFAGWKLHVARGSVVQRMARGGVAPHSRWSWSWHPCAGSRRSKNLSSAWCDCKPNLLPETPRPGSVLHRPLTEAEDLDEILAWREERTLTRNLTLRYDRMMLLLDPTPLARGLAGRKVKVVNYPDGRFAVWHEGAALPFRVFDKIQTVAPGAIVENKQLGAALAFARELQALYPPNRRRGDPQRQRPPNNLEAPGMPTKGRPSRRVRAAAAAE